MTFTDAALDQGRSIGYRLGLTSVSRSITRNDVQAIVTAVLSAEYDVKEMYAEASLSEYWLESGKMDALNHTRLTLNRRLAVEVIENGCIMMALPYETMRQEFGMRMIRLTVPVRMVER